MLWFKKTPTPRPHSTKFSKSEFVKFLARAGVVSLNSSDLKVRFIDEAEDFTFEEISLDSMSAIEIAVQLEEEFQTSFSPETILKQASLNDLYLLITGIIGDRAQTKAKE